MDWPRPWIPWGRRTGLALTDDVHMTHHAKRWDLDLVAERPTVGSAVAERTAAVIWNMLEHIDARIFLWNVFPLHPHESGDPFTNRQHNARERRAGEELLQQLIDLLQPSRIVAIGNDAAAAAHRITDTVPVICVRHPSYGGQTQFQEQISELYGYPLRTQSLFERALAVSLTSCNRCCEPADHIVADMASVPYHRWPS